MILTLLRKSIVLALSLSSLSVFAQQNTEMESFVARVAETNTFVPVSNIWQVDKNFNKAALLQKVDEAQPLTIDYAQVAQLIKQRAMAMSLSVPSVNGATFTLDLARYDFLSNDFQVHAIGANNADNIISYTPGLYYRGLVNGIKGSLASLSVFNNEVYGLFSIPGVGNYLIVPNVMVGNYYDYNPHYIIYNDNDIRFKDKAPACTADRLPDNDANQRTTTVDSNKTYNNCSEVRVFELADHSLYVTKGHNVTNVTNYLTALFNNQSLLYRNEGIIIALKYVQIDTATDVYQSITDATSYAFLDTFGKRTQNVLHGCDVAILASTKFNDGYGALGGLAWLATMCQPYHASNFSGPYAYVNMDNSNVVNFPTFSWDVEVITHEMGHVVGSPHTHRCCWNPPGTGHTAIDGCYTIEGTCDSPAIPLASIGGTIMSYCHLTSSGINLSNGFGPQPGDTVRYFISHTFSSSCGDTYNPSMPLAHAAITKAANRECTDLNTGITYYWNDNNTGNQADDTLVLMIKKNGNNIGNLNTPGFSVTSATIHGWGTGAGKSISFPAGTPGILANNAAMRRYWKVHATTRPTSAVEVIFPFLSVDSADIDGSVSGVAIPVTAYMIYKADSAIDPAPGNNFPGASSASFRMYTNATTASATNWSLSTVGGTHLAHMLMTDLSGGGSAFYSTNLPVAGIENIKAVNGSVYIYPNPTNDQWFVSVAGSNLGIISMQLYTTDGKMVHTQLLKAGTINTVNAADLPTGIYYYRIISSGNTWSGSLLKK